MRTLQLNGIIAQESWFDDEVSPQMFKDELMAGSGDIEVFINSPGGDCVAASQIYTMLNEYRGNVTVKIDGIAASAASVIAMAGTTTLMSPTAIMMIHNPLTFAEGNAQELQKAIEMLDEVKESIINAYELKSGLSRAKISHLMDAETWLNAGKALELGLIDGIMYTDQDEDDEDDETDADENTKEEPDADGDDDTDDDEKVVKNHKSASFSFSQRESAASLISKVAKAQPIENSVDAEQLHKRLNLIRH